MQILVPTCILFGHKSVAVNNDPYAHMELSYNVGNTRALHAHAAVPQGSPVSRCPVTYQCHNDWQPILPLVSN